MRGHLPGVEKQGSTLCSTALVPPVLGEAAKERRTSHPGEARGRLIQERPGPSAVGEEGVRGGTAAAKMSALDKLTPFSV